MFKEIEIKGYRGLKNIKLKDLERINVLIGENNSGKTSVLEAIQLFSSKNVIENAIAIARKREVQFAMPIGLRLMPYDMLLYSFPIDKQEIKEIDINGYRDDVGACHVSLRADFHRDFFVPESLKSSEMRIYEQICDEDGFIRTVSGEYLYDCKYQDTKKFYLSEIQTKAEIFDENGERHKISTLLSKKLSVLYVSPADIYSNRILNASLYKGMLVDEKRRLIELLRLFDDRIIGIEVGVQYGRAVTLIEMEDCGLVPFSIFGDGLKKVLTLASAVVKTRGGILLIDEFETGIHKHALIQVAKWLAMATERYDVQVFVTTHSDDAIDALVSAQDDYNNINAYRLEHYKDRIFVKKFEGTDLYRLRREQGMDIL